MRIPVSVYAKCANQCFRICTVRSTCSVLRVCMTRKQTVYAYRKNLWMPATISWRLFAHFRTWKHAASVGLRHASMNVSVGLCIAYTTLSLLVCLFPCWKSRRNISSRSCHWAPWAALLYDSSRYARILIQGRMRANSDTEAGIQMRILKGQCHENFILTETVGV